uniref:Proteasome subunit alpha type n=1 Tax=Trepomonas sp. PC1 TaxID=1076344 RepID=A0A146KE03_9EUKA|eukprot:JAP94438.1 20S proteasome alpha subunit 1 [Trepomonas sp. PC1]
MTKEYFDQNLTVFSPEGKLYQLEYANEAVNQSKQGTLALRCPDGYVFFAQLPTFDRLQNSSKTSYIYKINDYVNCLVAGRSADGRVLVERIRSEAAEFYREFGYQPTADVVAERIADVIQVFTQEAHLRPYGNVIFLAGWDDENDKSLVYRVDPTGSCLGVKGFAAGFKSNEMNDQLIQKKGEFGDVKQALRIGLGLFQKYVSASMTGDDVEVWIGSKTGLIKMGAEDVDNLLEELKVE